MPLIGPGFVVGTSPMLGSRFDVRRRSAAVGENGRSKTSDQLIKRQAGTIAPSGSSQKRGDAAGSAVKHYTVVTQFPLRMEGKGVLPDIILYRGQELLVNDVQDFTGFGSGGWVEAKCSTIPVVPHPTGVN